MGLDGKICGTFGPMDGKDKEEKKIFLTNYLKKIKRKQDIF